jgi:uncharacterized protein YpuA (DUF1002 family)
MIWAVSDTQTVIGALLTILSPVIGLAILADSLIGNHEVRPMIGYVKNNLNLKLTDEQINKMLAYIRCIFNIIKSIRILFLK